MCIRDSYWTNLPYLYGLSPQYLPDDCQPTTTVGHRRLGLSNVATLEVPRTCKTLATDHLLLVDRISLTTYLCTLYVTLNFTHMLRWGPQRLMDCYFYLLTYVPVSTACSYLGFRLNAASSAETVGGGLAAPLGLPVWTLMLVWHSRKQDHQRCDDHQLISEPQQLRCTAFPEMACNWAQMHTATLTSSASARVRMIRFIEYTRRKQDRVVITAMQTHRYTVGSSESRHSHLPLQPTTWHMWQTLPYYSYNTIASSLT